MTVHLEFATLFSSALGFQNVSLSLEEGATLGDAIDLYLHENPEYVEKLKEWKLFLAGKLRAIYLISGNAVTLEALLQHEDRVKVMQAFIGG